MMSRGSNLIRIVESDIRIWNNDDFNIPNFYTVVNHLTASVN